MQRLKGRLNTDTSPQNFWTTFLANDLTEKFKKSAAASAIAILLPLCFSCFVPLRRFRENLTKPFYFYLSRTCDSPGGTPPVISLALNIADSEKNIIVYYALRGRNWTLRVECDVSSMNRRRIPYHTRLKSNFNRLLQIIFFITQIHRLRFVSVNGEASREKP